MSNKNDPLTTHEAISKLMQLNEIKMQDYRWVSNFAEIPADKITLGELRKFLNIADRYIGVSYRSRTNGFGEEPSPYDANSKPIKTNPYE